MSDYNLKWRRYGLKDNPYFIFPLSIEGGIVPITSFIGREEEKKHLKEIINHGDARFLVYGESGAGKTSLINYVRWRASEEQYFTPINEIDVSRIKNGHELIILTLSSIYDEIKRRNISLSPDLEKKLDAIYSITRLNELRRETTNITALNYNKLMQLFKETTQEIIYPRFKGIIIYYDNLDNLRNLSEVHDLFGELRDFLYSSQKVIFFFAGDHFTQEMIRLQPRVRQIFITPSLEVPPFIFEEIKKILDERIEKLKMNENIIPTAPHSEKALRILFNLYNGNLREMLNSLSNCVLELPPSNTPLQIDEDILRDLLYEKVNKIYFLKLTEVERGILLNMIDRGEITPTELTKITGKTPQNIASKYLPKLIKIGAIEKKGSEGRNTYYEIVPEIRWHKLQRTEKEKKETKEREIKKATRLFDSNLNDFM